MRVHHRYLQRMATLTTSPAFYSTARGQIALMRESVGQNYEGLDTPILRRPSAVVTPTRVVTPEHPFVGRAARATWHVGTLRETHEGLVLKVDRVATSSRLRLVLQLSTGHTIRCYTEDPEWTVEIAPA